MQKEHETDMPHCWCNPKKEVLPNGNMHIIHNEITMKDSDKTVEGLVDKKVESIFRGDTSLVTYGRKGLKDLLTEVSAASRREEPEIVICAAVRAKDGFIVRGHRHGHALYKPFGLQGIPGYEDERSYGDDQGFITSKNRYVTRKEAYEIQKAAGIESADKTHPYQGGECYSEDLY